MWEIVSLILTAIIPKFVSVIHADTTQLNIMVGIWLAVLPYFIYDYYQGTHSLNICGEDQCFTSQPWHLGRGDFGRERSDLGNCSQVE